MYRYPEVASENGVWISRPSKAGNCAMQKPKNSQKLMLDSNSKPCNVLLATPHDDKRFVFWDHVRQKSMSCVEKVVSRFTYSI